MNRLRPILRRCQAPGKVAQRGSVTRVSFPSGLFLLILLLCGTLAACGHPPLPADGPTPTVTVPPGMPVVITLAGWFDAATFPFLDGEIADFEAANPDIRVGILEMPRDATQRREQFVALLQQGDTGVDILLLDDSWLAGLVAGGGLTPLDRYVRSQDLSLADFLPAAVEANRIHGQLMALPWIADGGLLYFRADLLDRYGHTPPTTWAELQRLALDLKAREGLPSGYVWPGAAYEGLTCSTLEFVWASGGDLLDNSGQLLFDIPPTRSALQQMSDLIASGASPPEVTGYQEGKTLAAFQKGEAALMRNRAYAWAILNAPDSPLAGRVGVAPLPASCLMGQSLALSAHSLHPEQALRFMAFLVGHQAQVRLALQTGQPPALVTAYEDEALAGDPFFAHLPSALAGARPRPQTAAYPRLSEVIYTEVNRMLSGQQSASTTAANIQRRGEEAIQKR